MQRQGSIFVGENKCVTHFALNSSEVLNISFINGIFVPNDAISNIMRDKINAICYYYECNNIAYKTKIFVQYTDL